MVSSATPHVLLFGTAAERAQSVCNVLSEKGLPTNRLDFANDPSGNDLRTVDVLVCVLDPNDAEAVEPRLRKLLRRARAAHVAALVWGVPDNFDEPRGRLVEFLPADITLEEVIERLSAMARYAPVVKRMESEMKQLQRLGQHLTRYFDEIDYELRLAGRLQRDFLPRKMPAVEPIRFAQLYRPAAWVSGDIFDVFQIDDQHLGLLIADAMGHGTAAGLMTMFLRRALVPRVLKGNTPHIVAPADAMREMHDELARLDLPHAPFVTAAYMIFDIATLDVRLARGGHPYPLRVSPTGEIEEMRSDGGLLGINGLDPAFEELRARLEPGEKVIFYTDGIEDLIVADRDPKSETAEYTSLLRGWARLDADGFIAALVDHLDHQEGSLNPEDDVTVVVAEVAS